MCSNEYEHFDWESTRRSFQSSYEEIRRAFDSEDGRRLQRPVSTTVNGDCSTSHLRQRLVYESLPYHSGQAFYRAEASSGPNVHWFMSLDGRDRNGDRHRNTSTTVEVV